MALSIGIVLQCDGCMLYHLRNALKAGANAQEVYEAANVAIMMGGGPAVVYAAKVEAMLSQLET
ncbi:MAG: carboxymuconolactone decarboxylase family protein [Caldilineaceae bacterium]